MNRLISAERKENPINQNSPMAAGKGCILSLTNQFDVVHIQDFYLARWTCDAVHEFDRILALRAACAKKQISNYTYIDNLKNKRRLCSFPYKPLSSRGLFELQESW